MRPTDERALAAAKAQGADAGNAVAAGNCFGWGRRAGMGPSGVDLKGFVSFHVA
jgi:hypothetical protein